MKYSENISGRHAILVLGMHRSGTSALTRLLGLRGVTLPAHPLKAAPNNETGFWEPAEIVGIHDEILKSAGSAWDDTAEFPDSWFSSYAANEFKERLSSTLDREFGDAPLFVLKDPRLCLLLPLWLSLLEERGITPLFVIPIRNPFEVSASLKTRDLFRTKKSLMLWLRYFLAAERHTRSYRRSFVAYDTLLSDWRSVVNVIGQDLGIVWPRQSYASDVEIEGFLSADLRHHRLAIDDFYTRGRAANWARTAFAWAVRAAEHLPTQPDDLNKMRDDLNTAERSAGPLDAIIRRTERSGFWRLMNPPRRIVYAFFARQKTSYPLLGIGNSNSG